MLPPPGLPHLGHGVLYGEEDGLEQHGHLGIPVFLRHLPRRHRCPAVSTSKALLNRMSKRPHFSTARSTIILMSECRLTSTLTASDSLPAARILSAFLLGHRLVYVGD